VISSFGTGFTPLHNAVKDGTRHQIQLLLDYGAAIDAFDDYFGTPLHCAALYDNLEACQLLLESEEGLKCLTIEDEQGCVPVRLATTSAIEILRLLLEKGAAVDVSVDQESSHAHGGTALSRACGYEQILGNTKETNTVVIQTLLVAGADPNKAVGSGSTPIVIALRSKNLTAVKVMLDNGVLDSRLAGYWDNRVVLGAAAMGNRYVWRKSIQVGVDVNMVLTNDDGYRAIHIAAGYGNGDTVKTLVEGGATIEARTSQGLRPLHMACARGTVDCVKALLQLGAEIDATDFNRMNSLQLAAFNGHLEVVRTLLDPSRIMVVVVGHRVTTGLSAADLAMSKGHGAVTDFLVKAGDLQHLDRQFWE
jgi:ankyrin repeat protein